jgi:hypothetical protein
MKKSTSRTISLIALSAGGDDDELAERGLGMEHVDELMVRVAKKLLNTGNRLCFGGTLGISEKKLTQYLIETAQNWLDNAAASECDVTNPATWPLVNYAAWPHHTLISEKQRANQVGVCQFTDINPPGVPDARLKVPKNWKTNSQAQVYIGDSLSEMRDQSTRDSDLRIVWAGKIKGSSGWMPGILEEVGYSLAQNKPVLILGGYGGCAGLIAKYLADKHEPWPEALTLNTGPEDQLDDSARQALQARFDKIKTDLTDYRTRMLAGEPLNGLSADIVNEALTAENGHRMTTLVAKAIDELSGQQRD